MKSFSQKIVVWSRNLRENKLNSLAKVFLKWKISANVMTSLALVLGILSIYFLFNNYLLFVILGILHLLADALDGIIARNSQPTKRGKYFDYLSDRLITILMLVKIYFVIFDYYILLVLGLYVLGQTVHLLTKFQYPAVFIRSGGLAVVAFYPLFNLNEFLVWCYLAGGVFSLYTLALQIRYFVQEKF